MTTVKIIIIIITTKIFLIIYCNTFWLADKWYFRMCFYRQRLIIDPYQANMTNPWLDFFYDYIFMFLTTIIVAGLGWKKFNWILEFSSISWFKKSLLTIPMSITPCIQHQCIFCSIHQQCWKCWRAFDSLYATYYGLTRLVREIFSNRVCFLFFSPRVCHCYPSPVPHQEVHCHPLPARHPPV